MRTSECSVAKDAAKCFEPRLIAGGEFPTHRQHRTARLDHAQECGGRLPYRLEKSVEQLTGGATSPILVHKGELSHGVHARRRLQHVLCQRLCSSASRTHTNTTIIACVGIGSVAFSHPVFSRAYREYCCGGRIGCETDEAILWMHLRMWVHLHKERMRESEDWCGPFRGVGVGERADEIPSKIKKLRPASRARRVMGVLKHAEGVEPSTTGVRHVAVRYASYGQASNTAGWEQVRTRVEVRAEVPEAARSSKPRGASFGHSTAASRR
eukprot:scaffold277444_cov28-Tisochrysis_lutea.AAC.2